MCVGGGVIVWGGMFLKITFFFRFCPLFPFQSIKTVRLRLNLTRQFIEDQRLVDSWSSQRLYHIMYSLCLHSFFPESKCSLMWYSLFSVSMCECCFWWGIQEEQYRVGNTGDNNCLIISCYLLLSVVLTHVITGGFAGLGVQGIPTVTIQRCFVKILSMIIIPSRWAKLISKW